MAHIKRSIEVDAPVDTIHALWLRFEEQPRCPVRTLYAEVRWRAEVLTFEPLDDHTRITLKIEYEPHGDERVIERRVEGVLRGFTSFLAERRRRAVESYPA